MPSRSIAPAWRALSRASAAARCGRLRRPPARAAGVPDAASTETTPTAGASRLTGSPGTAAGRRQPAARRAVRQVLFCPGPSGPFLPGTFGPHFGPGEGSRLAAVSPVACGRRRGRPCVERPESHLRHAHRARLKIPLADFPAGAIVPQLFRRAFGPVCTGRKGVFGLVPRVGLAAQLRAALSGGLS